jgi:hypothetical protein
MDPSAADFLIKIYTHGREFVGAGYIVQGSIECLKQV